MWLDQPEQWDKLAEALTRAGEFGLDTETYGQPDKTSPQHRTKVQCWSVGVLGNSRSPRGYRWAAGRVLPRDALFHPSLRAVLLDSHITKWAHNSPHDEHSIKNEGIDVAGMVDSLQYLRTAVPGQTGYGLKEAERWALGLPARPSFIETVTHPVTHVTARGKTHRGCICGRTPCHARSASDWLADDDRGWLPHTRVTWRVFTPVRRVVGERWGVEEFNPGHERWAQWLEYSLADAVRGIMLVDWIRNQKQAKVAYPWRMNADVYQATAELAKAQADGRAA